MQDDKNAEIEVLRAVAVIVTFVGHLSRLYHWDSDNYPRIFDHVAWWGGVDLFFTISGFVIARSLLGSIEKTAVSDGLWRTIGAFWIRRIYRILPSAWMWLAIGLILTVCFNGSRSFGYFWPNAHDALAAVYQIANFHLLACIESKSGCGPLFSDYWSLSLEEQFYLALPLVLYWCPRRHLAKLLALIVVLQFPFARPAVSFGWIIRVDAICLGVLLALFSQTEAYRTMRPTALGHRYVRLVVVGLLILGVMIIPQMFRAIAFSTGLLAIVCAILVWISSYQESFIMRDGWWRRLLVWAGSRSYAIYLVHTPALLVTREIWARVASSESQSNGPSWEWGILAVTLTVIFSEANFRLIEVPLRSRGRLIARAFLDKRAIN